MDEPVRTAKPHDKLAKNVTEIDLIKKVAYNYSKE
jgi:hypothetical protein